MEGYPKFEKIPRLFRPLVVSEKIDGTNGLIEITEVGFGTSLGNPNVPPGTTVVEYDDIDEEPIREFWVRAGSRTRWISPAADNFGFAKWVQDNAEKLIQLGPGLHYGEWWGKGIQRGYGLDEKRFSLFNLGRWHDPNAGWAALEGSNPIPEVEGLTTVPPLMGGVGDWVVGAALQALATHGSIAAPGWPTPEGVVVFHTASNAYYKATLDNDGRPKTEVQPAASKLQVVQAVPEDMKGLVAI